MFIGRSNHWTGGSRVRFLPRAWKFPLSRASMVSPPSKLKMFTGSVCVLLTSVSLKLIKIKIKLIYATTSSWQQNKMAGESWVIPTDFIFLFIIRVVFFLWSDLIRVQFYVIFIFLFDPSWSESIRVDLTRTGSPSWSGPTFVPACFTICASFIFLSPKCYFSSLLLFLSLSYFYTVSSKRFSTSFAAKSRIMAKNFAK